MLIKLLIDFIVNTFDFLTKNISIPSFPDETVEAIDSAIAYVVDGLGVLDNYIDVSFCLTLFGVYLAVEVALNVYYFIMWILKKVPFIGVE